MFGLSFDYLRLGRVSPGVFWEYFLRISFGTPKNTNIVFSEYFGGIPYFAQCSGCAECNTIWRFANAS